MFGLEGTKCKCKKSLLNSFINRTKLKCFAPSYFKSGYRPWNLKYTLPILHLMEAWHINNINFVKQWTNCLVNDSITLFNSLNRYVERLIRPKPVCGKQVALTLMKLLLILYRCAMLVRLRYFFINLQGHLHSRKRPSICRPVRKKEAKGAGCPLPRQKSP